MEKLPTVEQEKVRKMSTDRLRAKLLQADYDEEKVIAMSREQLLATYAEFLISGKAEAAAAASSASAELELKRQEIELRKAELAERAANRAAEAERAENVQPRRKNA